MAEIRLSRREFLRRIFGLAGAAATLSAAGRGQGATSGPSEPARPQGYRETRHIRSYYRKARF